MNNSLVSLKRVLVGATIVLFVLSMLTLFVAMSPVATAQVQATISVTPSIGSIGSAVDLVGSEFNFGSLVSVSLGDLAVASVYADNVSGSIEVGFTVPSESAGDYVITAVDTLGGSASTTFTIISETGGPIQTSAPSSGSTTTTTTSTTTSTTSTTSVPTSNPSATSNPSSSGTTYIPPVHRATAVPVAKSGGFWSPLAIGIVAAALIIFAVPAAFLYARHGKGKMYLEQEYRNQTRDPPVTPNRPTTVPPNSPSSYQSSYRNPQSPQSTISPQYRQPSSYGYSQRPSRTLAYQSAYQSSQSSRSTISSQYSKSSSYGYNQRTSSPSAVMPSTQSSNYSRPQLYTKICPHCKRTVGDDRNICPNCNKRLK